MSSIQIKIDMTDVEKGINGMRSDIPWVIQNTINDLLKIAQQEQYKTMQQNFTIRNKAFLKYSVRITQFAKRNSSTGILGIADMPGKRTSNIWTQFEGGGIKTPTNKNLSVPSSNAWGNRNRTLPQNNRPRNLTRSFVIRKNNTPYIFIRRGKNSRSRTENFDPNIKMMYTLKPGVRIPDKLNFYSTTIPAVKQNYQPVINKLVGVSLKKRGVTVY